MAGREPEAGPELDRLIGHRVLGRGRTESVPAFSTEDWTASALAELITKKTRWSYDAFERNGRWWVTWMHRPRGFAGAITIFACSTAVTQSLAICRALLRATETKVWAVASAPRGDLASPPARGSPKRGRPRS